MNAIERLKDSMVRVEALVDFHRENPNITIDIWMDSMSAVTIGDLKVLLEGLRDRDISLKRPKFVPQKEIERDITLAKEIVGLKQSIIEQKSWLAGYDKGYTAGRDGEMKAKKSLRDFLG